MPSCCITLIMAIMNIFMLYVKIIITVYFSVPRCNVEVLYIIMHVFFSSCNTVSVHGFQTCSCVNDG